MIIAVYQSGGLAGSDAIPLGEIDTSRLSPAERARVGNLTRAIENPPQGSVPVGADMVEYHIRLRPDSGPDRTIVVPDDMSADNPLLRSVHELIEMIGER